MRKVFRAINILLPVAAVILLVTQVIVSNELGTLGKRMGQLDIAVSEERDIHESLETQVASASSLMAIRERAILLGFHDPASNQIVALTPEVPVAFGVTAHGSSRTLLPQ